MQDIISFILKNLVTHPDDVNITSTEEDGVTNYTIATHPDDVGRIIGKEGKVIKAIRTVMRVIAIQKGVRLRISVLSDQEKPSEEIVVTDESTTPDSLTLEI